MIYFALSSSLLILSLAVSTPVMCTSRNFLSLAWFLFLTFPLGFCSFPLLMISFLCSYILSIFSSRLFNISIMVTFMSLSDSFNLWINSKYDCIDCFISSISHCSCFCYCCLSHNFLLNTVIIYRIIETGVNNIYARNASCFVRPLV